MNEGEGIEEWDADFLDQLIKVEEQALSSQIGSKSPPATATATTTATTNPTTTSHKLSYLPPPPPQQQKQQDYHIHSISYSPPRELSQRPLDCNDNNINNNNNAIFDRFSNGFSHSAPSTSTPIDNTKDLEIDRLKKELGHVSKQLIDLEHECFQVRKESKRKEAYSRSKEKDADAHSPKRTKFTGNSGRDHAVHSEDACGISQHSKIAKPLEDQIGYAINRATSSSKAIGVQTDRSDDFSKIDLNNGSASHFDLSNKLLGIWGSMSAQQLGRNLISKLFMACPTEFQILFGCMSMNMLPNEMSSHAPLQNHMRSFPTSDAAKVCHLYSVLTKINNGVLQLEALFGPLIDLCDVSNVAILSSSLHILHVFLKHLLSLGTKSERGGDGISCFMNGTVPCTTRKTMVGILQLAEQRTENQARCTLLRDNIKVEGRCSENSIEGRDLFGVTRDEASYAGYSSCSTRSSDAKSLCKKGYWKVDITLLLSSVNWVSLFELMHQIAVINTQECVRLEAVSIMNVILVGSNADIDREKFGQTPIFESIAQLLKKEAGSCVQKEALRLLYLLLNCSKLLSIFCSAIKEEELTDSGNDKKSASTPKGFSGILEGLADCIACSGNSIQDVELRKRAIIMLAFLASSGKSSFEVMVSYKLPGDANFLMLILQVLVSEMDIEASISAEPVESIKARTLLIREALILLNRLVSNPVYSASVLRLLTASRDMASLTIDIGSRLSREDHRLRQSDVARQMKDSEIVELAQVFRKRVFTFLGDKIS